MAFAMRTAFGILSVLGLAAGAACDGMVDAEDRAQPVRVAPAQAEAALTANVSLVSLSASDAAPLDNGSCMSNADCPSDYPNCCQVGGYASCFEESCADVGGKPKGALATTTLSTLR